MGDTANALGRTILPVDNERGILMIRENINRVIIRRESVRGRVSLEKSKEGYTTFYTLDVCV